MYYKHTVKKYKSQDNNSYTIKIGAIMAGKKVVTKKKPVKKRTSKKEVWKKYRRQEITEMRPYVPGEDMSDIAHPKGYPFDNAKKTQNLMIARNPANPDRMWLIPGRFFLYHFVEVKE
jgi:hypothetical protein